MINGKMNLKKIISEKMKIRKKKPEYILSIYFGVPGSGKTTMAAYLAKKDLKQGKNVWSNVPITGTNKLDTKLDIGKYDIYDGRVIIDEAGVEYNNRDFKNFSREQLKFFKYHRHNKLVVDIFSQGYDDMDKKIRTLAQRLYVVKKSLIPYFIVIKRIAKKVDIDKLTKQIIDAYYFLPFPFGRKWIFAPLTWKLFNTYSREKLPEKVWEKW